MLTVHYDHVADANREQEFEAIRHALVNFSSHRLRSIKVDGLTFEDLYRLSGVGGVDGKRNKMDEITFTEATADSPAREVLVPNVPNTRRFTLFAGVLFMDLGGLDVVPDLNPFFNSLTTEESWRHVKYIAVRGVKSIQKVSDILATIDAIQTLAPTMSGTFIKSPVWPRNGHYQQA